MNLLKKILNTKILLLFVLVILILLLKYLPAYQNKFIKNFFFERYLIDKIWTNAETFKNFKAGSKIYYDNNECIFNSDKLSLDIKNRLSECYSKYGSGNFIFGDSHAIDFFGMFLSKSKSPFIFGLSQGGCRVYELKKNCYLSLIKENNKILNIYFKKKFFHHSSFYFLRNKKFQGSRRLISTISNDGDLNNFFIDTDRISLAIKNIQNLNISNIFWYGFKLEPHISKNFILNNSCKFPYKLRSGQEKLFKTLDDYFNDNKFENFKYISIFEQLKIKFPDDFLNCEHSLWSDTDHLSSIGEVIFSERISF